jgi:hypothetical protein
MRMRQSSIEADHAAGRCVVDPDGEELRDLHQRVHNPVTAGNHQNEAANALTNMR